MPNRSIEKNEMVRVCSTCGDRRGVYRLLGGCLRERDHLEDQGVDGRIRIRGNFRKWNVGVRTGLSWLKIETGGGQL
jgi:hypothetical protein